MANKVVSVTKRIKTAEGLRYCPVARNANGRIKQDAVLVNGSEERHPEGSYYISWLERPETLACLSWPRCERSVQGNYAVSRSFFSVVEATFP
jgi:hypothetical protein